MGFAMRIFGAFLLLACAIFLCREYSRYLDRRLEKLKTEATTDPKSEIDRTEKDKKVAKALIIGGALALLVMMV